MKYILILGMYGVYNSTIVTFQEFDSLESCKYATSIIAMHEHQPGFGGRDYMQWSECVKK